MRIACVLMGLAVLVALVESSPLKRRSLSQEAQFRNAIEQTCAQGLNLSAEETATMERVQELQKSGQIRIDSQDDVDRIIDQEAPSRAVANSLKPKFAALVECIVNEFKKMLGLRRRR
ncbi:uncharacterized protein LOC115310733 [Ixodes scapularis]|uniref:Putative conserved secreted protein n=1 Tax=Ixodes scapularis TaxID=6945 RepID=A0A4D5RMX9_IXOSC|nr:uncharacterized protein LOC115310733 [Ixodes scapularis]